MTGFEPGGRRTERLPASVEDLLAIVASSATQPTFFWEHPRERSAILGVGIAREIRARGPRRFAEASEAALRALGEIRARDAEAHPLVVGGFGFSAHDAPAAPWHEFPAVRLFVPQRCWVLRDGACRYTEVPRDPAEGEPCANAASRIPFATSDDEPAEWHRRVRAASERIRDGSLEKVVLARRRTTERGFTVEASSVLEFAHRRRPSCFNFCVNFADTAFVGSSPERLVRLVGPRFQSGALAGSIARGRSADDDRRNGAALLASAKDGREHALVVDAVHGALRGLAESLTVASTPELVGFPESYHLFTKIEGTLAAPRTVVELAGALHPTPAVCGTPRAAALELIERDEPDRGWYGGTVGWMDADGDGEFTVAIRAALLDGPRVSFWAGAGIVDGSDSEAELAETENKMRALDRALCPRDSDDEAAA